MPWNITRRHSNTRLEPRVALTTMPCLTLFRYDLRPALHCLTPYSVTCLDLAYITMPKHVLHPVPPYPILHYHALVRPCIPALTQESSVRQYKPCNVLRHFENCYEIQLVSSPALKALSLSTSIPPLRPGPRMPPQQQSKVLITTLQPLITTLSSSLCLSPPCQACSPLLISSLQFPTILHISPQLSSISYGLYSFCESGRQSPVSSLQH